MAETADAERGGRALRGGDIASNAASARSRAGLDRRAGVLRVLPDDVGDRPSTAASTGILCQGRGSAANSAVCYCLGITAVDPDRASTCSSSAFLSESGVASRPTSISTSRTSASREVIQHVYAKYGRDHAAMVANFIRFRARSAVRDVGKALGIPETALDRLSKDARRPTATIRFARRAAVRPGGTGSPRPVHRHLAAAGLRGSSTSPATCRSIPGGFLLGTSRSRPGAHRERRDARPHGDPVGQGRLEELGLFKVDLLGLGALHQLHLGFDLIERTPREVASMASRSPRTTRTHLRHDLPGRHRRRVPDRKPRADGHAAAPETANLLRPGDRGQHRAPRPDHRRHGASLPAPPNGRGGGLPAPLPRAGAEEDARRAAVPGAG